MNAHTHTKTESIIEICPDAALCVGTQMNTDYRSRGDP